MKELVREEIALVYDFDAAPERVFTALTAEIGKWWTHRFKEGSEVGFEPRIGGRFYEEWEVGGAALYATVTYIDPPRKLRLEGPMGMSGAVAASMEFELADSGKGTRLSLVHDILASMAKEEIQEYRMGWAQLLGTTLRGYLEGGKK
jgi:uncharacterized protein YndB with AHSA1/START domain